MDGGDRIKLADFGLSKAFVTQDGVEADLMSTYCGTTDYAAPEVLRNQPYDGRLTDIWSIGVVLFAMLSGCFPFKNINNQMGGIFQFPPSTSPEAKELISRILVVNPRNRFPLEKILEHPWCAKARFLNPPTPPPASPTPVKASSSSTLTTRNPAFGHHKSNSVPDASFLRDSPSPSAATSASASASSAKGKSTQPVSAPTSPLGSPSSSPAQTPVPVEFTSLSDSSDNVSPVPRPRSTSSPMPPAPTSANTTAGSGSGSGVPAPPPPPPPPMPKYKATFNNFSSFVHDSQAATHKFFHQRFRSDEGVFGAW